MKTYKEIFTDQMVKSFIQGNTPKSEAVKKIQDNFNITFFKAMQLFSKSYEKQA